MEQYILKQGKKVVLETFDLNELTKMLEKKGCVINCVDDIFTQKGFKVYVQQLMFEREV